MFWGMSDDTTKRLQQELVQELKRWQRAEAAAVRTMDKLSQQTTNTVLQTLAEIIREDSRRHARVQQVVIDSLQNATVVVTPEDLAQVWTTLQDHIASERDMFDTVRAAVMKIRGRSMPVQQMLLEYLMYDEEKHNLMLEKLEGMKKGMYPG